MSTENSLRLSPLSRQVILRDLSRSVQASRLFTVPSAYCRWFFRTVDPVAGATNLSNFLVTRAFARHNILPVCAQRIFVERQTGNNQLKRKFSPTRRGAQVKKYKNCDAKISLPARTTSRSQPVCTSPEVSPDQTRPPIELRTQYDLMQRQI